MACGQEDGRLPAYRGQMTTEGSAPDQESGDRSAEDRQPENRQPENRLGRAGALVGPIVFGLIGVVLIILAIEFL